MQTPLIDDTVIQSYLTKPYRLERERKRLYGETITGAEEAQYYSKEDLQLIDYEAERLLNVLILESGKTPATTQQRLDMTAGGPGAGKTMLFLNLLKGGLSNSVYFDVHDVVLQAMEPYQNDLTASSKTKEGAALGYEKWRWAAYYINSVLMNQAASLGYDIAYGTTGTNEASAMMFSKARTNGIFIKTHMVSAPDAVRLASAMFRYETNGARYTLESLHQRGEQFRQRVSRYQAESDAFDIYWRAAPHAAPVLAATGGRNATKIQIVDEAAWQAFNADLNHRQQDTASTPKAYVKQAPA